MHAATWDDAHSYRSKSDVHHFECVIYRLYHVTGMLGNVPQLRRVQVTSRIYLLCGKRPSTRDTKWPHSEVFVVTLHIVYERSLVVPPTTIPFQSVLCADSPAKLRMPRQLEGCSCLSRNLQQASRTGPICSRLEAGSSTWIWIGGRQCH